MTSSFRSFSACFLLLIFSPVVEAEPRSWDGGGGADRKWETGANWNPNGEPISTSDVTFGASVTPGLRIDAEGFIDFVVGFVDPFLTANSLTIGTVNAFTVDGDLATLGEFTTLILSSGDVTRQDVVGTEGDHTFATNMRLAGDGLWNIGGAGKLSVESITEIGGSRTFTKLGAGTLKSSLNVSGAKTISQGVFEGSISGAGIATFASGASFRATGVSDSNITLTGLNGSLFFPALSSGSGAEEGGSISGLVTLVDNLNIATEQGSGLHLSGGITDNGLSKGFLVSGSGTLEVFGAGTFSGNVSVFSEGQVLVGNNTALGSGLVSVSDSSPGDNEFPTLAFADGVTFSNPINLRGARISGSLFSTGAQNATVASNISLQGLFAPETAFLEATNANDTLTITGTISEAIVGSIVKKTGNGRVILSGANTFTGGLTVEAGVLGASISAALSGTVPTAIQSGARFDLLGDQTLNAPIQISGPGFNGVGALRSASGDNTWAGSVALGPNTSVGAAAGSTLTVSGPITGAFGLTKVDGGTLRLTNAANNFTSLAVSVGTLSMSSPTGIPAAVPINVSSGGAVSLLNSTSIDRTVNLNGAGASATVGALDSEAGDNTWAGAVSLQSASTVSVRSGSLNVAGSITGAFGLTKIGPGELTLSGVNSHGNTTIQAGVLRAQSNGALPAGGTVSVAGGASLEVASGVTTGASSLLRLNGQGSGGAGALSIVQGAGTVGGPVLLETSTTIGAATGATLTISGQISDATPLPLVKVGLGTLALTATNTFRGDTIIDRGTLAISTDAALGASSGMIQLNNGSKLVVRGNTSTNRTLNLTSGSIQVNAGVTYSYSGATVTGGFLRGPGTHAIVGSSTTFNGTTALPGSNILQSSVVTLNNFSNAGALVNNAPLTWSGGFNLGGGAITVNSELATDAFENDGLITVSGGGTLSNSGNDLASTGGSRITINTGGALQLNGTSLNLHGALAVNNGTISGTTNVHFGSLAKGTGNYGTVNVFDGGTFSPGSSPGEVAVAAASFNVGGRYLFEVRDATGLPGAGYDHIAISGTLDIGAGSTANSQFVIELASLDAAHQPGMAANFSSSTPMSFILATAEGGITGFAASKFRVDTSKFQNSLQGGNFTISLAGNNLLLTFAPSVLAGDYNNNGTVDAADYTLYRDALGTNTTLPNDTTPGSVATADYNVWQTNFGQSASAAAASAVPEPSALLFGLLAALAWRSSSCFRSRYVP